MTDGPAPVIRLARVRAEGASGLSGVGAQGGPGRPDAVESWALALASGPVRVSAWERAEGEEVGRSRVGSGRERSWATGFAGPGGVGPGWIMGWVLFPFLFLFLLQTHTN